MKSLASEPAKSQAFCPELLAKLEDAVDHQALDGQNDEADEAWGCVTRACLRFWLWLTVFESLSRSIGPRIPHGR